MQKFGKNRDKQKVAMAKLDHRIGDVRRDFVEKISPEIGKNQATIFRKDLKIKNMTASAKGTVEGPGKHVAQKSALNRSVLNRARGVFCSNVRTGRTRAYGDAAEYKSHLPDMRLFLKRHRKRPALFKCISCAHRANAEAVGAIHIKERGRSLLACGESEKKGQVNSGQSQKPGPSQP